MNHLTYIATLIALGLLASRAEAGYCVQWERGGTRCVSNLSLDFGPSCRRIRPHCRRWVDTEPYRDSHWRDVDRRGRHAELHHYRSRFPACKGLMIRATGDDKLNERDAKVSAQDRWAITVEARFGTLYSDIDNAHDMDVSCVKKVPTSTIEKGQAGLGIRHHVCEIEAMPCQPDKVPQDSDTRAKRRFER